MESSYTQNRTFQCSLLPISLVSFGQLAFKSGYAKYFWILEMVIYFWSTYVSASHEEHVHFKSLTYFCGSLSKLAKKGGGRLGLSNIAPFPPWEHRFRIRIFCCVILQLTRGPHRAQGFQLLITKSEDIYFRDNERATPSGCPTNTGEQPLSFCSFCLRLRLLHKYKFPWGSSPFELLPATL